MKQEGSLRSPVSAAGVTMAAMPGYEWVALSVTTLGALLASLQSSALLIALPEILVKLQASFLTVMWILIGYLLITTALVPVIGRLADMLGRKNLYNAGFAVFTLGSLLLALSLVAFPMWGWTAIDALFVVGIVGLLALATFLSSLHLAFVISAAMSLVAAFVSFLLPSQSPRAAAQVAAPPVPAVSATDDKDSEE